MQDIGRVAVLYGGVSPEREISLKSGRKVFDALSAAGIDVSLIDVSCDLIERLQSLQPDRVFMAMHGAQGEDGTIQAILDFLDIPYTGSGVRGSAIAMDKCRSKMLWRSINLPTPDFQLVDGTADIDTLSVNLPCFVKPNCQGSSIATFAAHSRSECAEAVAKAARCSDEVLIEKLIEGEEFTVAIVNDQPLPVIRLETDRAFYDYDAKYASADTLYHLPCGLTAEQEHDMQELALAAFHSVGCSSWGRVDIMRDTDGNNWLLEVNTTPGMTDHSLVPMAAKATGYEFEELVIALLRASSGERQSWMLNSTRLATGCVKNA